MRFKSNQKVFITKNAPSSQLFEVFMTSCCFAKGILENNKGFGIDFLSVHVFLGHSKIERWTRRKRQRE